MNLILKTIKINIYLLFIVSIPLRAENFLEVSPNKSTPTLAIILTQNDKDFIKEMQKYPKNTAFFIDGKTEKIISTNTLLKLPATQEDPISTPKKPKPTPKAKKPQKSSSYIPYQMQEERIELLR
ncbi:MAG: hypothetical protein K2I71_05690 [Helicobacter sp.]|nr:hypothetical protein [Helicobacter sp.]